MKEVLVDSSAPRSRWMTIEDWLTPLTEPPSTLGIRPEVSTAAERDEILALRRRSWGSGVSHRSDAAPRHRVTGVG